MRKTIRQVIGRTPENEDQSLQNESTQAGPYNSALESVA